MNQGVSIDGNAALLADIDLFRALTSEELLSLGRAMSRGRVRANSVLASDTHPATAVYVLLEGRVKLEIEEPDGNLVVLGYLGRGDLVGEDQAFRPQRDHLWIAHERPTGRPTAIAVDNVEYLWMEPHAFRAALLNHPALALRVLSLMTERLGEANDKIHILAAADVPSRVASQLLSLANRLGERSEDGSVRIPIRLPQSDLAASVGASRESVNRAMVGFKRDGLVATDSRQHVTLPNPARLAELQLGGPGTTPDGRPGVIKSADA